MNAELKARITKLEAQKGPGGDRCDCNLKVEKEIIKKETEYFESDIFPGNLFFRYFDKICPTLIATSSKASARI